MSDDDRNISMQYRDPITREHRTVTLCSRHDRNALYVLRQVKVGCSATDAGALHSCDPCRNEARGQ